MKELLHLGLNILFVAGLVTSQCWSQARVPSPTEGQSQRKRLFARSKVTVQNTTGGLGGLVHCDSKGNVYLRGISFSTQEAFSTPIGKYSSAGELIAQLMAPDVPDRKMLFAGWTVDAQDNLYVAARAVARGQKPIPYALKFDKNGKLVGTIALQAPMLPYNIAGFETGEMLVSGLEIQDDNERSRNAPFTGLFSDDGKLLKRLDFAEDKDLKERANADIPGGDASVSIIWGSVASSSDGNVYVMRATSPAVIYAISAGGEIVRTLIVDPQEPRLLAHWLQASEDVLVIGFARIGGPGKAVAIVRPETGEIMETYDPGPLGSAIACFDPASGFTFVGSDASRIQLVHATPAP